MAPRPFFVQADFDAWKARVLRLLARKESRLHAIVDRGALPIFSLRSNRWFGIKADVACVGQPRPPRDVTLPKRWRLAHLLTSGRPMRPSARYTLLDHTSTPFLVMYVEDFVLDGARTKHARLHLNNLYPRETQLPWLTGGDLLHACGILYALLDVQFLTVCEGGVRAFENAHRVARPGYLYYDKVILVPPQHLVYADAPESEEEEEEERAHFATVATRDPATIMRCWLWDKAYA